MRTTVLVLVIACLVAGACLPAAGNHVVDKKKRWVINEDELPNEHSACVRLRENLWLNDKCTPAIGLVGSNPMHLAQGDLWYDPGFWTLDGYDGIAYPPVQLREGKPVGQRGQFKIVYHVKVDGTEASIERMVLVGKTKPGGLSTGVAILVGAVVALLLAGGGLFLTLKMTATDDHKDL